MLARELSIVTSVYNTNKIKVLAISLVFAKLTT